MRRSVHPPPPRFLIGRVWGSGFRACGSRFWVGFTVENLRFRVRFRIKASS